MNQFNEYTETMIKNRIESNRIESNRIESNQTNSFSAKESANERNGSVVCHFRRQNVCNSTSQ